MIFDMSIENLRSLFDGTTSHFSLKIINLSDTCYLDISRLWRNYSLEADSIGIFFYDSSYGSDSIGLITIGGRYKPEFYLYGWRTRNEHTPVSRAEFIDFVMLLDPVFSDLILWNGL